jgi:DNA-binding GntR family transcriptional regulator
MSSRLDAATSVVRRKTVVDLTAEALRERILRGEYHEGEALRQDALAADMGVSRIPVREALRQLEVEGLVTFSPHAGAVVSSLSLDEISEIFELRAMVEAELLRLALPNLTPEVLDRADNILDAYEAAFDRGDIAAWGELNWEFHSTLLAAAARPLTLGMLSMLHNQGDRYTRLQLRLTHGEGRARFEHRAIAAAARDGQTEHAVEQLREHILSAGRSLILFLRAHRSEAERD